jgi:Protein of unknown function (DUF3313)
MKFVFSVGRKLVPGLVLLLFAGTSIAQSSSPASYVKPDIDLSIYTKVLVKPLNMDDVQILKPAWEQDKSEEWTLEIEDFSAIQKSFMDAMRKELETNGGYALVSDPAADVLQIEVEILTITPHVRPGTPGNKGGYKIETLGSGDLVFSAEFRDSQTRELLILVEGERPIGEKYRKLSAENHMKNLAGLFSKWGAKIREVMDEGRSK